MHLSPKGKARFLASAMVVVVSIGGAGGGTAWAAPSSSVGRSDNGKSDARATKSVATQYFRIVSRASGQCLVAWGAGNGAAVTQVRCDASMVAQWWNLDPGSIGTITNRANGTCIDLFGNDGHDNQTVFTWSCYGAPQQKWRFVNRGGPYYEIHAYYTDKCLDLAGSSPEPGAVVQQFTCNGGNNQSWWIG